MSKSGKSENTRVASLSPYERRVQMVVDTIQRNEKLSDKSANSLAVAVLHAIDHIPERVR
ncbi:MAG TPA: DUF6307 family protein [Pseudonocardia sp.]|jgi:hypothetical protein|nr:DUF6307 family protein [Pseudonocardia sp.]